MTYHFSHRSVQHNSSRVVERGDSMRSDHNYSRGGRRIKRGPHGGRSRSRLRREMSIWSGDTSSSCSRHSSCASQPSSSEETYSTSRRVLLALIPASLSKFPQHVYTSNDNNSSNTDTRNSHDTNYNSEKNSAFAASVDQSKQISKSPKSNNTSSNNKSTNNAENVSTAKTLFSNASGVGVLIGLTFLGVRAFQRRAQFAKVTTIHTIYI